MTVFESANAQEATGRVYTESSGQVPASIIFEAVNLGVPLTSFVNAIRTQHFGDRNSKAYLCDENLTWENNLPVFSAGAAHYSSGVIMPGDLLYACESFNTNRAFTLRIYLNGAEYRMAVGDDADMRRTIPQTGEFFILSDGMTATVLQAGVLGFAPPTCTGDDRVSDDMLMCRPPTNDECMLKTPQQQLNTAGDMCEDIPSPPNCGAEAELNGNVCECQSGFQNLDTSVDPQICEMIPATTPPTCADDSAAADCTCPAGETRQMENSVFICAADSGNSGMTATVNSPIADGGGSSAKKGFVFGVIGLFFAVHFLQGDAENFSYSPAFGYAITESGYSANVGGRIDFRKDEWRLFWTAGQANANGKFGDFRYSSGGEYKTDFWTAAFSESVQGETANYDLSLSADLRNGIWSLSPVYRMHSRLEKGESATRNSLNLEGVLRYEDWRITPSAGFGWRRAENFGDSAKFRLEAVREF